jgi:hypothetical protein
MTVYYDYRKAIVNRFYYFIPTHEKENITLARGLESEKSKNIFFENSKLLRMCTPALLHSTHTRYINRESETFSEHPSSCTLAK